jgi:LysR family transcriptional regulator, glycine cleavage system transcriptional activator
MENINKRLPALIALQAFEAAARHQNYSSAALDLAITASGIGRHVQSVEHWFGAKLFSRHGPRVAITIAGQQLSQQLSEVLESLHALSQRKLKSNVQSTLTVLTLPSLASSWLLGKIASFQSAFPHIQLHIVTSYSIESLLPHLPAVALRFGAFDHGGLQVDALGAESMLPVAHRKWMKRFGADPKLWPPEQLLRHAHSDWPARLVHAQMRHTIKMQSATGLQFNDALLQLQAVEHGLGVAWLRQSLPYASRIQKDLHGWQEYAVHSERAYWLACRSELAEVEPVRSFRLWALKQE